MILNDIQKKEVLKLFENEVNMPNIDFLDLMQGVENVFLNFESYEDLKHIKYDLRENFLDYLETEHFIYYADAIDYLKEEDSSLRQSLEIAKEFYTAKEFYNICSTTLANLLYHEKQIELIDNIDFDLIIQTIKNQ
jgi:hypothetical protein